jgi:serine phosphatase RsbU (regulator of sigma subunit)/CHASE3 domain sensor protein
VRLSLRWKIVGGFGVLLVLVAILSWVTFSLFASLRAVQRKVFDDAIPGLVATDEIVRSYTAQSAAIHAYLIKPQPLLLAQYRAEVENADLYERVASRHFEIGEEQAFLEQLVGAGDAFNTLIDVKVIPRAERGDRSQAFRILGEEARPLISEIERLSTLLRKAQDSVVFGTEADISSRADQTVVILLGVTLIVVALGIILAVVLSRRFSSNLERLVDAARAIGRGDFDQQIDIRSGDEVEELAERFVEMQAGLKRLQQLALHDRELEIAASIQRNLLQRTLPVVDGITVAPLQRQANLIGGDWYDVEATGGHLTVAVGDASGKGIAAALMATVTLSALRAERGMGGSPAKVIERANTALKEATDPDSFTTLVYATINTFTGEVRWLNMGHPSPLVLRAESSVTEEGNGARGYFLEGPRNRVLGWFDDPGTSETHARLQTGDRLVLFTDGFLEAKSPEGEVFGEHRLAAALARLSALDADAIGPELVREVETFAAGKLDDDLTMLVVEFQGATESTVEAPVGEESWRSRR